MPDDATGQADRQHSHRFHDMFISAWRYAQDFRSKNELNYAYYDGDQWTDKELEVLEDRGQPATVLNMIRPTQDMLLSMLHRTPTDTVIKGREPGDDELAKILTEVIKSIKDASQFQFYRSKVFRDGATGGIGWFDVCLDDTQDGERDILVEQIPWEEMFFDPFFRRWDASDARFLIRQKWMDIDEVAAIWPSKSEVIKGAFANTDETGYILDYEGQEMQAQSTSPANLFGFDLKDKDQFNYVVKSGKSRRVAVHEVYYTIPDSKHKGARLLRHVIYTGAVVLKGKLDDDMDAENDPPYGLNEYPWVPFIAFRNQRGEPQGLVEFLRSPQDQINKLNSKYISNISTRQVLIESDAAEDADQIKREAAKSDGFMVLQPGALTNQKIILKDNFAENQQTLAMTQNTMAMMQRISGVNDAVMGFGGVNARSAEQEAGRLFQGTAMQSDLFQNFLFAINRVDRILVLMIAKHWTKERVIRLMGPDDVPEYVTLNKRERNILGRTTGTIRNDVSKALKYDILIKQVESFDSARAFRIQQLTEAAKSGVFPPQIASELLLRISDVPYKDEMIQKIQSLSPDAWAMPGKPAGGQMVPQPQPSTPQTGV